MNLAIDAGNTLTKVAFFENQKITHFASVEVISLDVLHNLLQKYKQIKNVILASVIENDKEIIRFLKSNYNFIELNYNTNLPVENLYKSPETLGKDRLASAVGANFMFRNCNVLSVDVGTCIKYDFVNEKNQYLGGGISPGIEMRFKALNKFTEKLPLLTYRHVDHLIGTNTEESVVLGVMNGVEEEIKGIIRRYEEQYTQINIVFTGGYVKFCENIFDIKSKGKSNIFADPFLVLKGLNHILKFNEKD